MIGAFFDVDGTLYNANMWRGLVQYVADHGGKNRARWYMARNLPLMLPRKLRLIDEENFRKPWVWTLGGLIKDWNEAQADAAFRWVAEQYIMPTANPEIIARLKNHVAQGHVVVLVSAMLAPTLQVIGDALDVSGTVGTAIECVNNRYTGRVIPPVCMGIDKARMTKQWLAAKNVVIDFPASYAYADSYSDLSLFEMVGRPTPVYPDEQLQALGRSQSWEMILR